MNAADEEHSCQNELLVLLVTLFARYEDGTVVRENSTVAG